jgi:hypothetical protein
VRGVLHGALERLERLSERRRALAPPSSAGANEVLSVEPITPEVLGPEAKTPALTLEQYVSLCVETELEPALAQQIDARYGVANEAARAELHRSFGERLAADPALKTQWAALYAHYREWFRTHPRAGDPTPPAVENAEQAGQAAARAQRTTSPNAEARAASLPFAPAERPAPLVGQKPTLPSAGPGPEMQGAARATIAVTDARRADALPFKSAEAPDLSVEQYAALTVELEAYPQRKTEIIAMYGITTDAAWRATESIWTARIVGDGALRTRWMKLVADLRTKLVRR